MQLSSSAQESSPTETEGSTKKAKTVLAPDSQANIELWSTRKLKMRFGMQFHSNDNQCSKLFATIPFPREWPEQKVKILSADLPDNARYKEREVPGGAMQLILEVPALAAKQQIDVVITAEIEKSFINPPAAPESLVYPKKSLRDKDIAWYLGDSPLIDAKSRQVRDIVKELRDKKPETAWAYVESIYDWVRNNIAYRNGELRSTRDTLKDKYGDCEEMSGLFVALCRASIFQPDAYGYRSTVTPNSYSKMPMDSDTGIHARSLAIDSSGKCKSIDQYFRKAIASKFPSMQACNAMSPSTLLASIVPSGQKNRASLPFAISVNSNKN